ncbi:hypothetical protein Tco_0563459 [Tanacetum coccineum]
MESVTQSDFMVLPYGMLLTRLYRHVHTTHPYAISNLHNLVDHVMIPLTKGKTCKIMIDGKRPHPQTPSESSLSPSPTQNQEENDPVNNYTLDPSIYMNQLLPIPRRESPKFKQTKGMFKCFGYFPSNQRRSKDFLRNKEPWMQQPVPYAAMAGSILEMELSFPVLQALVFSTPPSSPIEPHPYLTSLEDLPPRSSNPLPPPPTQGFNQTLPQHTPIDFESFFPTINLSRRGSRMSAHLSPHEEGHGYAVSSLMDTAYWSSE